MSGPPPKDPSTRRRRNQTSTRATLPSKHDVARPPLPDDRAWHTKAVAWWEAVWASPMATEFVDADVPALERLVLLVHFYWTAETPTDMLKLASEIRLQQVNFGLTPYDRRRLEWTIEQTDEAKDRGARRRAATAKPAAPTSGRAKDPRDVLRLA
jgi:hypothetical protein